jgi:hypothetical protein
LFISTLLLLRALQKTYEDETEKNKLKKRNQANLNEFSKLKLISQSHKLLKFHI